MKNSLSRRKFLVTAAAGLSATASHAHPACSTDTRQHKGRLRYFGQAPGDWASCTPFGDNPSHGHAVRAGDVDIYYETYGRGRPVLVLHGGGVGCAFEMGRFIELLSENHSVIVPSTRGHGRSGFGTERISYEQKALDMMAVMKAEGIEHARVVGFSDGAYAAYKIAEMFPDFAEKITAIGAGENIPGLRRVKIDLEEMRRLDPQFIAQQEAMMPDPHHWQQWLSEYADFYSGLLVSKNIFMKIHCPVLLVSGELDQNAPLDTVLAAWKEIPVASLAVVAGAPHQCFITNFDAVWANVRPFIYS